MNRNVKNVAALNESRQMITRLQVCALAAGLVFANTIPSAGAGWPVFGYDPARSGVDGSRRILTVRNVVRLRSRWQISLGAIADSTPILLEHIKVGGISR